MASTIKVDNVQNQPGTNIINKCSVTTTIGAGAGETIKACAATVTLGRCGGTVALASGATQTGFGASGAVSWNTTKITADPANAVSGTGYFCDTSGGVFTVTLPTSPSAGDIVAVADYTRTFATNNLTVGRNSKPIGGVALDAVLAVDGQAATFVFVDDTEGWINTQETQTSQTGASFIAATGGTPCAGTTCGSFKIHKFTGPGTFCVSAIGNPVGSSTVDYLVVAGGGGGGAGPSPTNRGGGAGAGGYRESSGAASGSYAISPLGSGVSALPVSVAPYTITVGGGGPEGVVGVNSTFSTITSGGGGYGGPGGGVGGDGGSGGGGGKVAAGGAGNTPPTSPPQGQPGGTVTPPAGSYSGGGGGALVAGPQCSPEAGSGGDGAQTSISTVATYYAGGGGGSGGGGCGGGCGGGGSGPGSPGVINTGGGGGGGNSPAPQFGGVGGSGIVYIRYKFQ
jgi:hypothetical protein